MLVNILALIYGAVMIINIGLWHDAGLFGNFGGNPGFWNPFINGFFEFLGQPMDWLPAWPLYETIVGAAAGARGHLLRDRGARLGARRRSRIRDRRDDHRLDAIAAQRSERLGAQAPAARSCGANLVTDATSRR